MRLIFSRTLFYIGDAISNLLYFEWIGIVLYPVYKKLMIWSSELDKDCAIWKNVKDE
ncbi:hypothetical protein OAA62_00590 [bacterium]|nr:hypothetical protein [bacterium]